ncbi:hypothetical protein Bca4012_102563 [Brassica carinata]
MIGRADIEGSKSTVAMSGLAATSQLSLCRIPLVRTSSELAVRRRKARKSVPSPSPADTRRSLATLAAQAAANSRRVELGPRAQPSEPILFRDYGSILPTSLAYIVPSTRGCSPWRPDAVMKCDRAWRLSVLRFSRARECTDTTRRAICTGGAPPGSRPRFCSDRAPSYSSRPGSCPAAGIGRASAPSISGLVDSAGMLTLEPFSEDQGRSAVHREDPANQLPYALRVYSPVDSHTCQTPWSVFQGGSNGSPQAAPEHADARRAVARAADHD